MIATLQAVRMIATAMATISFGLAGLTGLVYIMQITWRQSPLFPKVPPAERLDRWMEQGLAFGMPWLTLSMVSAIGEGWLSTGRVWPGDPQTSSLLALWLYYSALLSGRLRLNWAGVGPAWMTLVGAVSAALALAVSLS
ncbi:MAG: cytochrome c biogenesis protein CcsA [Chloroflexi bacterium]|nr:cytochrome c biogenesis protein CcsA [Chloroflexota bacterium]